jgi:hypothetical protein
MKRTVCLIVLIVLPALIFAAAPTRTSIAGNWMSESGKQYLSLQKDGEFALHTGWMCKSSFLSEKVEKGTYRTADATGSLRLEGECPKSGSYATISRAGDRLRVKYRTGAEVPFTRTKEEVIDRR